MDSWASSACYPQRTFYPLSDGPPTWDHRITMTDFRLCSSCQTCSQAGFCHCTQRPISDRSEPTFARLPYCFGGGRPPPTPPPAGADRKSGGWGKRGGLGGRRVIKKKKT